jgi:regulator of replication initiation timing
MNDTEKILQAVAKLTQKVDQQGKVLAELTATVGTILEEQQAQRIDIRSLHEELHATKEELKSEILSSRAEAKRNTIDLQATLSRKIKGHDQRIDDLEDETGIPHPDEN